MNVDRLANYHPIRVAYNKGITPPTLAKDQLGHWGLIQFEKTFPIDPKLDILEMLSDKAMSLDHGKLLRAKGPRTI